MTSSLEPFCLHANARSFLWPVEWWDRALAFRSAADFRGMNAAVSSAAAGWSQPVLGRKGDLSLCSQGTGLGTYLFSPSYSNLILTLRCWKKKQRTVRSQTASWTQRSKADRSSQGDSPNSVGRPAAWWNHSLHIAEECACQKVSSSVNRKALTCIGEF